MKILVVGSGAREHAILKAFARSTKKPTLFCFGTSNNPGIRKLVEAFFFGDCNDVDTIVNIAKTLTVDMVFIGPEAPLEKGLADSLWQNNIPTIGPKKQLAQLETSKAFARDLMKRHNIAGLPKYLSIASAKELTRAKTFLAELGENHYVIKANGLMGGKGVKVAGEHLHSIKEAVKFCESLLLQHHTIVIEEKCVGEEFSFMCFSDGTNLIPMPLVQDHKRAYVNDKGPNTGGMGSYSDSNHSLPFLTTDDVDQAFAINQQIIAALKQEFAEPYIGILYGSFMATATGIKVIEFNTRFGDPESINVLSILESDFVDVTNAMLSGNLNSIDVRFAPLATVCKYIVPDGYPDNPLKNEVIAVKSENLDDFYFAAVHEEKQQLLATGSRAIAVVGQGESLNAAESIAEAKVACVKGKVFHRSDIGTTQLIAKRIEHMRKLRACYA